MSQKRLGGEGGPGEEDPSGSLPEDSREIGRISNRNSRKIRAFFKGPIGDCWVEKDGRLWNPRLAEEAEKQEVKSAKAKASIRARWHTNVHTDGIPVLDLDPELDLKKIKSTVGSDAPTSPAPYPENFEKFWNVIRA